MSNSPYNGGRNPSPEEKHWGPGVSAAAAEQHIPPLPHLIKMFDEQLQRLNASVDQINRIAAVLTGREPDPSVEPLLPAYQGALGALDNRLVMLHQMNQWIELSVTRIEQGLGIGE